MVCDTLPDPTRSMPLSGYPDRGFCEGDAADKATIIDYSRQELIRDKVQLVQQISSEIKLRMNTVPVPPFILIMGT